MTDRRVAASLLVLTLAALLAAGCGDANQSTATLYLKRNIETSQTGHVIHVLAPVVRAVPENKRAPTRVLEELLQGPTAAEAEDGFVPTLGRSIEVLGVHVSSGVATVNFGDYAPEDFFAQGAVVLSLTELPGISRGRPSGQRQAVLRLRLRKRTPRDAHHALALPRVVRRAVRVTDVRGYDFVRGRLKPASRRPSAGLPAPLQAERTPVPALRQIAAGGKHCG
jgi:hypothetical protein